MIVQIKEMLKRRIAYIRQVGPYGLHNRPMMERLKSWAASEHLFSLCEVCVPISE